MKEDYTVLLGNRIKKLRKLKNLTQSELAQLVNRSKNHISKIEIGCANPPLSLLFRIASALEIPPSELFAFESEQLPDNKIDIGEEIDRLSNLSHKIFIQRMVRELVCEFCLK